MSATKHTPGPWKVSEHSWCETSIVAYGFDHGICGLDINHATEESQEADAALMAANARLIAAAPDLLAALADLMRHTNSIEVLGEWVAADINHTSERKLRAQVDACIATARAAIAKATGAAS